MLRIVSRFSAPANQGSPTLRVAIAHGSSDGRRIGATGPQFDRGRRTNSVAISALNDPRYVCSSPQRGALVLFFIRGGANASSYGAKRSIEEEDIRGQALARL